jgi:hypothetical protein
VADFLAFAKVIEVWIVYGSLGPFIRPLPIRLSWFHFFPFVALSFTFGFVVEAPTSWFGIML